MSGPDVDSYRAVRTDLGCVLSGPCHSWVGAATCVDLHRHHPGKHRHVREVTPSEGEVVHLGLVSELRVSQ